MDSWNFITAVNGYRASKSLDGLNANHTWSLRCKDDDDNGGEGGIKYSFFGIVDDETNTRWGLSTCGIITDRNFIYTDEYVPNCNLDGGDLITLQWDSHSGNLVYFKNMEFIFEIHVGFIRRVVPIFYGSDYELCDVFSSLRPDDDDNDDIHHYYAAAASAA